MSPSLLRLTGLSCASLLLSACILAPRPATSGAATAAAAPQAAGADAPARHAVVAGQKLVVWDGDSVGVSAKGWQECNQKPECQVALAAEPSAGKTGTGLKFQGQGSDWLGFGWNWFGYWPSDGGTDISAAKVLTFSIKIESEAWDPKALTLGLRCSAGKKESEFVAIAEFTQDLGDGKWHDVVVPIDRFVAGKGAAFDKKTAWELAVGTWSQSAQNLSVYLDDVAFQ
jgi:hypothetical protein